MSGHGGPESGSPESRSGRRPRGQRDWADEVLRHAPRPEAPGYELEDEVPPERLADPDRRADEARRRLEEALRRDDQRQERRRGRRREQERQRQQRQDQDPRYPHIPPPDHHGGHPIVRPYEQNPERSDQDTVVREVEVLSRQQLETARGVNVDVRDVQDVRHRLGVGQRPIYEVANVWDRPRHHRGFFDLSRPLPQRLIPTRLLSIPFEAIRMATEPLRGLKGLNGRKYRDLVYQVPPQGEDGELTNAGRLAWVERWQLGRGGEPDELIRADVVVAPEDRAFHRGVRGRGSMSDGVRAWLFGRDDYYHPTHDMEPRHNLRMEEHGAGAYAAGMRGDGAMGFPSNAAIRQEQEEMRRDGRLPSPPAPGTAPAWRHGGRGGGGRGDAATESVEPVSPAGSGGPVAPSVVHYPSEPRSVSDEELADMGPVIPQGPRPEAYTPPRAEPREPDRYRASDLPPLPQGRRVEVSRPADVAESFGTEMASGRYGWTEAVLEQPRMRRFGVAHGMDGIAEGTNERAAQLALRRIGDEMDRYGDQPTPERFKRSMLRADAEIYREFGDSERNIRVTAAVFEVGEPEADGSARLAYSWAGTARIYVMQPDGSVDRSLDNRWQTEVMDSPEDLQNYLDGVATEEQLAALPTELKYAFWARWDPRGALGTGPTLVESDAWEMRLEAGAVVVALSGVHEVLTHDEIQEIMATGRDANEIARMLVTRANSYNGGVRTSRGGFSAAVYLNGQRPGAGGRRATPPPPPSPPAGPLPPRPAAAKAREIVDAEIVDDTGRETRPRTSLEAEIRELPIERIEGRFRALTDQLDQISRGDDATGSAVLMRQMEVIGQQYEALSRRWAVLSSESGAGQFVRAVGEAEKDLIHARNQALGRVQARRAREDQAPPPAQRPQRRWGA